MAGALDLSLVGWTPIRVGWEERRPVVTWCQTEGVPFTEPFFGETVEACLRNPFRLLFQRQTDMDEVGRFVADHPGVAPAGFIFHMSRCGSTLVSQMLGAAPEHLVLSEAPPIDSVLRAASAERETWLRWIVGALGQPRDAEQRRLFVKFDAWSAVDLTQVRRAFPGVPWLFLYRDPVEVLMSQARRRGAHMIPGVLPAEPVGITRAETADCSLVEYGARVLARICQSALDHQDDPLGTFVEYRQLPELVLSELASAWSLSVDAERLLDVARRDAKNPAVPFEPDRAASRTGATSDVRAAADRWLAPLYEQLERARAGQ